jgi:hypothetical protein
VYQKYLEQDVSRKLKHDFASWGFSEIEIDIAMEEILMKAYIFGPPAVSLNAPSEQAYLLQAQIH